MKRNTLLIVIEIIVIGGILFGWIAPLLFPSEEPEHSKNLMETLQATSAPLCATLCVLCVKNRYIAKGAKLCAPTVSGRNNSSN
ncbi:MAG: hypothetical protein ACLFWZ_14490 [Coleofasciculus sp.]